MLDRVDRLDHAAKARHDDGLDVRIARDSVLQDGHSVGIGQMQVDHEAVVGERLEPLRRCRRIGAFRNRKAGRFERLGERLPERGVVFDNQD